MLRILSFVLALAFCGPLLAQTAPKTRSLGAEAPKSALYVGNSFFYFNDSIAEQYTIAGNANNALVVPAGLAFAKSIARNPQVNLYNADKRHPSLAGSYLSACTILASVYGKSPVGNSHTGGLDAKTARFLQEVAADTVKEYLGL